MFAIWFDRYPQLISAHDEPDLPWPIIYVDDILVHSADKKQHLLHLQEVFDRWTQAGLTLRGMKCHPGMSKVSYLGHVFSGTGMTLDKQKVSAVQQWPTPNSRVYPFTGLNY